MNEFLNMGGYGFYVWSAFGISTLILAALIIEPVLHHRKARRDADDFHTEES